MTGSALPGEILEGKNKELAHEGYLTLIHRNPRTLSTLKTNQLKYHLHLLSLFTRFLVVTKVFISPKLNFLVRKLKLKVIKPKDFCNSSNVGSGTASVKEMKCNIRNKI